MRREDLGWFAVGIVVCALFAWLFSHDVARDRLGLVTGWMLIGLGLLVLLARGPLRSPLERAGLGPPRTPAAQRLSFAYSISGLGSVLLMRAVLGETAGFWPAFIWLLLTVNGLTVLYVRAQRSWSKLRA
jgi:FtsH-binding integral membrane protein